MNADHGQEPPSRPSAEPTDNTWILIDDTEEAEPPAADPGDFWTNTTTWGAPSDEPSNASSGRPTATEEPPAGPEPQSQDQGWGQDQTAGWGQDQAPGWGQGQAPGGGQGQDGQQSQKQSPEQGGQEQGGQGQGGQGQNGQGQGWDSFASAGTWNGMRAAAPGAPGGWGATEGWGAPQNDTAQNRPDEPAHDAAKDTWFAEDDLADDYTGDDGPDVSGGMTTLTDRLPSLSGLSFGPGFVTFLVICGSVLLTVSSIIWHPHVP